jgi:hypothetical protein
MTYNDGDARQRKGFGAVAAIVILAIVVIGGIAPAMSSNEGQSTASTGGGVGQSTIGTTGSGASGQTGGIGGRNH